MHVEFPALIDDLPQMLQWILRRICALGFGKEAEQQVELAAEEALVNIIQHGYKESPGKIEISFRAVDPKTIEITLKDRGIPHNPLLSEQELKPSLTKLGGHGVRLMLSLMDKVSYERKYDCNVLTMVKKKIERQLIPKTDEP